MSTAAAEPAPDAPTLQTILTRLNRFYGALPAPPRDPFTLFVFEALSAHATARGRDAALGALKRIRALTPDAMARTAPKKLEDCVARAGPYRDQRLAVLRTGVDVFRRLPQMAASIRGPLAAARRAIRQLPLPNDGGAQRMLLFAGDHPVLPVDAMLRRVAIRLGFGAPDPPVSRSARSVRRAVGCALSQTPGEYRRASLYLSHHGLTTCTDQNPHCSVCPLLALCPEGERRMRERKAEGRRSRRPEGHAG
jgi:endonuclease-3